MTPDRFPLALTVFFALFILLMVIDLYLLVRKGYSATVSATLLKFSQRFPIIPFVGGILIGTCFGPILEPVCHEADAIA